MSLYEHFTAAELACPCQCGKGEADMDIVFMSRMVMMRDALDFAIPVTSGFRCPDYNDLIYQNRGHAPGLHKSGPHTTGHAIDANLYDERAVRFLGMAIKHRMTGFGLKQHGPRTARLVHADDLPHAEGRPRPHIWTYA